MEILVLGAGGHVASAVVKRLIHDGHHVHALKKGDYDVTQNYIGNPSFQSSPIDAVIYCVGRCPPGGFLDAIKRPLSQFPLNEFNREIDMHMRGPLNVFQEFLPVMRNGGHFVFMSSAATRLLQMELSQRPPIHIYHHLAVIAGENALIEGMRMDNEVMLRNIRVSKILPPAISDSPFHATEGGIKPQATVTTAEVVEAIVQSLSVSKNLDVLMVKSPSSK